MNFFQYTLSTLFCFFSFGLSAQENGVGIGTTAPNPSAILHVHSDNQGVLLPRLNDSQESAIITSPSPPTIPNGLLYFNTTDNVFKYRRNNGYSSLLFRGEDGRIELDLLGAAGETAKSVIDFGANGDTPPDQLDGWKIRLWGGGPLTSGDDYGFGIAPGRLWSAAASGADFAWYIGNNERMVLNNSGRLFTNNGFESAGTVVATGEIYSEYRIRSNGGFRADGGPPGPNGDQNNGYAFSGNNGDDDSGVFSIANGEVNVYSNSLKKVTVNGGGQIIHGSVRAEQDVLADQNLIVTGQANLNGNVRTDNHVPIQVKAYTFGSFSTDSGSCGSCKNHDFLIDTNYPASEWNAVVVGYEAKQGDIDEDGDGDGRYAQQVGELFTFRSGNNWFVRCNFKTEGSHESWRVEIMWIHKNMSTHHGAP